MVYDEGFNIESENFSFFAFSKYEINKTSNKSNFNSKCFSTCVGWFHNKDKSKWGCYQAFKLDVNPHKVTSFNSKNNLVIVEPENITQNIIDSVINMQFKSIGNTITYPEDVNTNKKNDNKIKTKIFKKKFLKKNLNSQTSFLTEKEQFKLTMRLDSTFRNHALYVSKLREVKKNWNAEVNPNFNKMTIKELNMFAGQKSSKERIRVPENKINENVSEFPKSFDWKKILKTAGSQGSCGSCYAYSTMRMMEERLKIAYNNDVDLSVQHALDCSIYNQGCDGGYPFLVMKYASEFELIPETCKPYAVI
jgi:cathepsin C